MLLLERVSTVPPVKLVYGLGRCDFISVFRFYTNYSLKSVIQPQQDIHPDKQFGRNKKASFAQTQQVQLKHVQWNLFITRFHCIYRVATKKQNSRYSQFFRTCSDQQLSFFTLLDRASFPHYNNTKIIKFG